MSGRNRRAEVAQEVVALGIGAHHEPLDFQGEFERAAHRRIVVDDDDERIGKGWREVAHHGEYAAVTPTQGRPNDAVRRQNAAGALIWLN